MTSPSDSSSSYRSRPSGGALEPDPDAVRRRRDTPRGADERVDRFGHEPVVAWPWPDAKHRLVGRGSGDPLRRRGGLRPDRQQVAGSERGRPEPGQQVGRAAAEHRFGVDPAAHADVGSRAGRQRAHVDLVTRADVDGGLVAARDGDQCRLVEAELRADQGRFEGGGGAVVADQPIPALERAGIDGPGRWHADVRPARAAEVLHRRQQSGLDDLDHAHATNRTRSPGSRAAGRSRFGSKGSNDVRPISCQPPGPSRG